MNKLVYEELSYKIIGLAFVVFNNLGYGLDEKTYSKTLEILFNENKIKYKKEFYAPILLGDKLVSKRYFDFFIENKIILELKVGTNQYREACTQIFHYLKSNDIKLGIIIRFTKTGVKTKRIPNIR